MNPTFLKKEDDRFAMLGKVEEESYHSNSRSVSIKDIVEELNDMQCTEKDHLALAMKKLNLHEKKIRKDIIRIILKIEKIE